MNTERNASLADCDDKVLPTTVQGVACSLCTHLIKFVVIFSGKVAMQLPLFYARIQRYEKPLRFRSRERMKCFYFDK